MKKLLCLLCLSLLCPACSILPKNGGPETIYALRPEILVEKCAHPRSSTLLVAEVDASGIIAGNRIAFSRDGLTRGFYQYARWAEPLPARLQIEIVRAISAAQLFKAVSEASGHTVGNYLLRLELLDAYYDAQEDPGQVRLVLNYELIDAASATIITAGNLEQTHPVEETNAKGAVASFEQAISQLGVTLAQKLDENV